MIRTRCFQSLALLEVEENGLAMFVASTLVERPASRDASGLGCLAKGQCVMPTFGVLVFGHALRLLSSSF